jgi:hypothetical protein
MLTTQGKMNNSWKKRRYPYSHQSRRKWHLGIVKSLKLWLPLFFIVLGVIYFAEQGNSDIYQATPDYVKYALNIFTLVVSGITSYRVFEKCDTNTRSDRGLFGQKLLSAGIGGAGLSLLAFGYLSYFQGLFLGSSLSGDAVTLFAIFLGVALLLVSAYLIFKFERRSGIIVYHS